MKNNMDDTKRITPEREEEYRRLLVELKRLGWSGPEIHDWTYSFESDNYENITLTPNDEFPTFVEIEPYFCEPGERALTKDEYRIFHRLWEFYKDRYLDYGIKR